ncbi:hypothetical protein [Variovorax sp. KK3]|uniref:hypothetical protein n=1 Tax=Variovorax sp. KK3 TaxID=1855728 RepID=UPI0011807D91|nr:hypothetical protein [Variovorax sp. KK3]
MQVQADTQTQWSSKGLLRLLRATLPPAGKASAPASSNFDAPPQRLSSDQLAELAEKWRRRSAQGDKGADSVAIALEMLAERRAMERPSRFQAVGRRISELMQLS